MKCPEVRKAIDRMLKDPEVRLDAGIGQHLGSCPACAAYFENTMQVMRLTSAIRRTEPVLNNPDNLTDEIMARIETLSPDNTVSQKSNHNNIRILYIAQRLLAVASIILLMIFSYEEFIMITKISDLEKQNSALSSSGKTHTYNLENAGMLFSSRKDFPVQFKNIKSEKPGFLTLLKAVSYLQKNNER